MAFITGSHAYGCPDENSDVDVVVLMTEKEEEALRAVLGCAARTPLRAGNLNLIVCNSQERYSIWHVGTMQLIAEAARRKNRKVHLGPFGRLPGPGVNKAEATMFFDALFEEAGCPRVGPQWDSQCPDSQGGYNHF